MTLNQLELTSDARRCVAVVHKLFSNSQSHPETFFDTTMEEEYLSGEELWLPPIKYEYLDHTADVQIHAWGDTLEEAFEQCGMGMFGYMTELAYVEIKQTYEIQAEADDMLGLLYKFLDELLFMFSADPFLICKKIKITEFDTSDFRIRCKCYGEEFTLGKHPQGSEVKAITYSAMQIVDRTENNPYEVFVIVDI